MNRGNVSIQCIFEIDCSPDNLQNQCVPMRLMNNDRSCQSQKYIAIEIVVLVNVREIKVVRAVNNGTINRQQYNFIQKITRGASGVTKSLC